MKMQIRWRCCFALCLAVSGLAGLGDIPGPIFGTAEPITSLGLFAGTGIAFENCGGIDLEELDELGYVDRTHFLSLAVGLIGSWKVYRDASLEGKAFLAGPGKGYTVNWKQVVWRRDGDALAVLPGYLFSSGWKNVFYESGIDWFMPWVYREDLYGQSSVWELPFVYNQTAIRLPVFRAGSHFQLERETGLRPLQDEVGHQRIIRADDNP